MQLRLRSVLIAQVIIYLVVVVVIFYFCFMQLYDATAQLARRDEDDVVESLRRDIMTPLDSVAALLINARDVMVLQRLTCYELSDLTKVNLSVVSSPTNRSYNDSSSSTQTATAAMMSTTKPSASTWAMATKPTTSSIERVLQVLLPVIRYNRVLEFAYQTFALPGAKEPFWADCGISPLETFYSRINVSTEAIYAGEVRPSDTQHRSSWMLAPSAGTNGSSSSSSLTSQWGAATFNSTRTSLRINSDWPLDSGTVPTQNALDFRYGRFAANFTSDKSMLWSPSEVFWNPAKNTTSLLVSLGLPLAMTPDGSASLATLMFDVNLQFLTTSVLPLVRRFPAVSFALVHLSEGILCAWSDDAPVLLEGGVGGAVVIVPRDDTTLGGELGVAMARVKRAVDCDPQQTMQSCPLERLGRQSNAAGDELPPQPWESTQQQPTRFTTLYLDDPGRRTAVTRIQHLNLQLGLIVVAQSDAYFAAGQRTLAITTSIAAVFLLVATVLAAIIATRFATWTEDLKGKLTRIAQFRGDNEVTASGGASTSSSGESSSCAWVVNDFGEIDSLCRDVSNHLGQLRSFMPQHLQDGGSGLMNLNVGTPVTGTGNDPAHDVVRVSPETAPIEETLAADARVCLDHDDEELQQCAWHRSHDATPDQQAAAAAGGAAASRCVGDSTDGLSDIESEVSSNVGGDDGVMIGCAPLGGGGMTGLGGGVTSGNPLRSGSRQSDDGGGGGVTVWRSISGLAHRSTAGGTPLAMCIGMDRILNRRQLSVMAINIRNFSAAMHGLTAGQFLAVHEAIVAAVDGSSRRCRGCVDSFLGDHFLLTFNAASNAPSHRRNAADCALQIQEAIAQIHVPVVEADDAARPRLFLSAGIGSSSCVVGNFGVPGLMKLTLFGPAIGRAVALETMCADVQRQIAEDPSVHGAPVPQTLMMCAPDVRLDDLAAVFVLQCVTITRNPKLLLGLPAPNTLDRGASPAAAMIAAPMKLLIASSPSSGAAAWSPSMHHGPHAARHGAPPGLATEHAEWMYELQQAELKNHEYTASNDAFALMLSGCAEDGNRLMTNLVAVTAAANDLTSRRASVNASPPPPSPHQQQHVTVIRLGQKLYRWAWESTKAPGQ